MTSGRVRRVDISDKLRKQLSNTNSVAAFLSIKDLVDRHIKEHKNRDKSGKESSSLFFWKK